jgi:hypothetical protein
MVNGPDVDDFSLVEGLVRHGFLCELSIELRDVRHESDSPRLQDPNYSAPYTISTHIQGRVDR